MRRDFLIQCAALSNCFEGISVKGKEIIEAFGSVEEIFRYGCQDALEHYPPIRSIAGKLFSNKNMDDAARDIDWAESRGLDIISIEDSNYPKRLRECPDAPVLLYMRGHNCLDKERVIGIVGTRAATQYGRRYCEKIVEGLSHCGIKPIVVSGLALGIDTYAHTFSLKYGLDTAAVLGTGLDTIYPPSNINLSERILDSGGALISEFSPFVPSYPVNFVRRNRIIAGLSDCLLVVESKQKGGGLITARLAQDYDRSVFAVPGRIDDNSFKGCNELIEENIAALVTGADSIIKAMSWDIKEPSLPLEFEEKAAPAGSLKDQIVCFLRENQESDVSAIAAATGRNAREISLPLVELEMDGLIYLVCGDKYRAN